MTGSRKSASVMGRAAGTIRCAIYTRKSSEEGLEQAFNSLDTQREACAANIQSQRHEGWTELPTAYDDGGISGGTMQRPALQQLLADIEAGRIDTVVVYKVDRLTRSLADFAKIVDVFDAQGVSFVSVTQQFNTTTSMGRLTLNMLLSFAQFEREVTGERIRDKIAASKAKGMWMGGTPPLGYDAIERQLQINPKEADTVRHIFRRYAEIGKVDALRRELAGQGVVGKLLQRQDGTQVGGRPLQRGALYRMLQNPLYRGQIRHRDQVYEGQHPAIIDEDLWQRVQAQLAANRIADANKSNARSPSLLAGKIRTDGGDPFTPSHANKAGKRYRYYVSRPGDTDADGDAPHRRWRIPAKELERFVTDNICKFLGDATQLRAIQAAAEVPELDQLQALDRAEAKALQFSEALTCDGRLQLRSLTKQVTIAENGVTISLAISELLAMLDCKSNGVANDQTHGLSVPARLQRAGMEMRLVDERAATAGPDTTLVRLLTKAWAIRNDMLQGDGRSLTEIAAAHSIGDSYAGRLLRTAFLAPEIVEAILAGRQPVGLTANRLATIPELPADWAEQRMLILGSEAYV